MNALGDSNIFVYLVGQIVVAAAIWGGIKAEIRAIHVAVSDAKALAKDAHARIDSIIGGERRHSERRDYND